MAIVRRSLVGTRALTIWLVYVVPSLAADIQAAALNPALVSTGLQNLGNTCYMNAQLQCAFHIPAIRHLAIQVESIPIQSEESDIDDDTSDEESVNSFEESDESSDPAGTLESSTLPEVVPESDAKKALRELFVQMVQTADQQRSAVAPRSFCMRLGVSPMVQQDSQEFWKLLLPAIDQESISDLYKGSFEDYITALDGSGRERRREELFLDLSLDVASSTTLLDSLKDSFGEPELLSEAEGNGWRPEKGADKVDALKGSSLIAKGLPSILQFHLKRFNYDWQTDTMTKLNNRFAFPEEVDLSTICKTVDEDNKLLTVYDLQSIIVHMGEFGVGHYYSYVRPDVQSDTWYRFNDAMVESVTWQDVMEDAFGGKICAVDTDKQGGFFRRLQRKFLGGGDSYGWGGQSSNAYVVQYVRRGDLPKLYPEGECS